MAKYEDLFTSNYFYLHNYLGIVDTSYILLYFKIIKKKVTYIIHFTN